MSCKVAVVFDIREFTIHYVGHYGYSKRSGVKRAQSMKGNPQRVLLHFATNFGTILRTDNYAAIQQARFGFVCLWYRPTKPRY